MERSAVSWLPGSTDVFVIGGGPAGSTVSTLIAQRGYQINLTVVSRAKESYQQALNITGQ